MTSVNKIIVIGNLGRVSRDSLDDVGQHAFDHYLEALSRYRSAIEEQFAGSFAKAANRLAEALRQLRKLAGPFVIPKKITSSWMPLFNRTAAFFHAAKVDARNLP